MPVQAKAADIAQALFDHVDEMVPAHPIARPNISFTPPDDGKFLSVAFMPNRVRGDMIRFEDPNEMTGLLQIAVYWPLNAGMLAPQRVADSIIAHFARGIVINADGFAVRVIEDPWSSTPLTDESRAMIPVTVPWRAY